MSDTAPRMYGTERQMQVYLAGMQGQRPTTPMTYEQLEEQARQRLSPEAYGYVAGGAGGEETMRANRAAFERWQIVPRMLRNVGQRDLRVQTLGTSMPAPVMLAPIGVQSIVHPEAEVAVARAAASLGVPFILSTASSKTMEEVAQAADAVGNTPRWYQLYWGRDPELTASFLRRAERAGYSAIVVTLDTPILSWRERDISLAYLPFLLGEGIANYLSDPVFRASLPQSPEENPQAAIMRFVQVFSNPTLTWDDVKFLREHTSLPLLLKGILHPDDARHALDAGAAGIIVSNHGGRQVDGAIPALDALPGVVAAVQGRAPVLFDSGIRRGADVFRAVALGAKAVLLGRPYMWGLTLGGESGVRDVVLNTLADLDLTLALSGYTSCAQLTPEALRRA
ncbi:MAG TPA: alpha-hydroxy-acid oxidizing protein [Ktedonobacterales bacterium]|nr:alpha-hydroxy-acid oxidizing protein [Ktedonobacterales bacterium]